MTDTWKQWEGEIVDGRFRLHRFLGGSDHSAVFLTDYDQLPQKAALKFVEASPATASKLLSRWEESSSLSHPHLLRLLHTGRCQLGTAPLLYVITEAAEENLSQILPARPLAPAETEYMLRSVLEVLAYLHGRGLVHGRVKPSNIMAVGEQLKLSCDGVTRSGDKFFLGPPTIYDPPELATAGLSPAGDIWSLGVTLIEALTQKPSVGEGIRQSDPALPDTMPAPFVEIARQCLRLDPQRRWTVADIAARLLPSTPAPRRRSASRYVLPAAVLVALGGIVVAPRLLNHHPPAAQSPPPTAIEHTPATPDSQVEPAKPAPAVPRAATPENPTVRYESPVEVAPHPSVPSNSKAVRGAVAHEVIPPVSQRARSTITGKVRVSVRVGVDSSGKVIASRLESRGPSQYFAKLALESSRAWKFTPPQVNGQPTPSDWVLHYAFGRSGTEVHSVQVSPSK